MEAEDGWNIGAPMKVWVVEWNSAAIGHSWTDLKGAFSTKEAAESYASVLAPKSKTLSEMLYNPTARVYEFTLDQPKSEGH